MVSNLEKIYFMFVDKYHNAQDKYMIRHGNLSNNETRFLRMSYSLFLDEVSRGFINKDNPGFNDIKLDIKILEYKEASDNLVSLLRKINVDK